MSCNSKKSDNGFTLFEIMVVLAIIGIIMGIVIASTGSSAERNLKKTSNRFASTIRYLYNKAAIDGLYLRLVLDLDERSYWVEATADPVALEREGDAERKAAERKKQEKENAGAKKEKKTEEPKDGEKADAAASEGGDKTAEGEMGDGMPKKLEVPEPQFSQVDSFLLRPTKLPSSVYFKDVQVEHRSAPVEGGQESIYFFPNGYVEKAIINLRDENDEIHYSITTNPVSGRAKIENQYGNIGNE